MPLLTVENLAVIDTKTNKQILKDVSFELFEHDFLGIVGESGSGKSVAMREILRVNPEWVSATGNISFEGQPIENALIKDIRGKQITMILQDGMTAFNPLRKIGHQFVETFQQVLGVKKREALKMGIDSLSKLNFPNPEKVMSKYPHELSGGMLQRCMIAIALVMKPKIIIADEPTTALDSLSQMEVVKEIERLKDTENISFIFVSHDLGVVQRLAKRVLVMKDGEIVEIGTVDEVFNRPKEKYTQYLIKTRLQLSEAFRKSLDEGRISHD